MATNHEIGSTPIRIKNNTIQNLKEIGLFEETYDDVIARLIKLYKGGTIGDKGKKPNYVGKI